MMKIAIVVSSTRPTRKGRHVGEWVLENASSRDASFALVDLAEINLPLLSEPKPAVFGPPYEQETTRAWSEAVAGYDGFIFVVPEYNHSIPAPLKNALDHLYVEWQDKAAAFVSYGVDNGVRAVEHLRGILSELGIAHVGPSVGLSLSDFADGVVSANERKAAALDTMIDKLIAWCGALAPLRVSFDDNQDRPRFGSGDLDSALAATESIIAELQDGIDQGNADVYNRHFALDVMWGNPNGGTLLGYEELHAIHGQLLSDNVAGPSRYEIVAARKVAADVVAAHVRRTALDASGVALEPAAAGVFSEMALYVLVRRSGQWWLAAGQNTPIAPV
ncbi:MAG: NAD(P)H-dependent oxidoreductase [Sulfitobacter dubius]|uniref:NADPH-dependent FMN reductase n=1 Tax=Alphaproteobacteria TaxID=28211 RepID=UPI003298AECB